MNKADTTFGKYGIVLAAAVMTGAILFLGIGAPGIDAERSALNSVDVREFSLAPAALLRLYTASGNISVVPSSTDKLFVTITRRVQPRLSFWGFLRARLGFESAIEPATARRIEAMPPQIDESPEEVDIRANTAADLGDVDVNVHFDVELPQGRALDVYTGNGSIAIANIDGAVNAASGNGAVHGDNLSGLITARTRNGGIFLRDMVGALKAYAKNGPILVDCRQRQSGRSMLCSAENGDIKLRVPRDASFDIDASTVNGRVITRLPVDGNSVAHDLRHVAGQVGGGGPSVHLETVNGSVHVSAP